VCVHVWREDGVSSSVVYDSVIFWDGDCCRPESNVCVMVQFVKDRDGQVRMNWDDLFYHLLCLLSLKVIRSGRNCYISFGWRYKSMCERARPKKAPSDLLF